MNNEKIHDPEKGLLKQSLNRRGWYQARVNLYNPNHVYRIKS